MLKIHEIPIGDPKVFGNLQIMLGDGGRGSEYWVTIVTPDGEVIEHDDGPFDDLAEALDEGVYLVDDFYNVYFEVSEGSDDLYPKDPDSGDYLEVRELVAALQVQVDVIRSRIINEQNAAKSAIGQHRRKTPPAVKKRGPQTSGSKRGGQRAARASGSPDRATAPHSSPERDGDSPLHRAGLRVTAKNKERWGGLDAEEILDAIDRGFPDAQEYRRFGNLAVEFSDLHDLDSHTLRMVEVGVSVKAARSISSTSRISTETVRRLINEGLSEERLLEWLAAGDDWVRTAQGVQRVVVFNGLGFSPLQVRQWEAFGFTQEDAELSIGKPFTVSAAFRWAKNGWHATDAVEWVRCGFRHPAEAEEWFESFCAEDAAAWRSEGITDPKLAQQWSEHFGPLEASKWMAKEVSLSAAIRRAAAGIRP